MTNLEEKIEELRQKASLQPEGSFDSILRDMARFVFNDLYFREATNEVEPWADKEDQDRQQIFADGWNHYRERVRDTGIMLGIIKKSL